MAFVASLRLALDDNTGPDGWATLQPRRALRAAMLGPGPVGAGMVARRLGPVVLWLVLLAPAAAYHIDHSSSRNVGIKGWFATETGVRLMVATVAAAMGWIAWRTVAAGRMLWMSRRGPVPGSPERPALQMCTGLGALTFGTLALLRYLDTPLAGARLVTWSYLLSALLTALLITVLVLVVLAALGAGPGVLVIGGGLAFVDVLLLSTAVAVANRPVTTGAGPPTSLGPWGRPGPPEPPWPRVLGPMLTLGAVAAMVGLRDLRHRIFGARNRPPEPPTPHLPEEYTDAQGVRRWRDTNQSVEQFPNRAKYEDANGIWRWSDTNQPTNSLHQDGALTTQPPDPASERNANKKEALRLEIVSADAWAAEGREVLYISDSSKRPPLDRHGNPPPNPTKRPDHLVDGDFRDVYSPSQANAEYALKAVLVDKIGKGQAQRVDIVLSPERSGTLATADIVAKFESTFRSMVENDDYNYVRDQDSAIFPPVEITVLEGETRVIVYQRKPQDG